MYDRQTESWWQQFTGEAIVGAMTGTVLEPWPARLESFARFQRRFPDGLVLVPADPDARDYGANPYLGYDGRSAPYGFFRGELPDELPALGWCGWAAKPGRSPCCAGRERSGRATWC